MLLYKPQLILITAKDLEGKRHRHILTCQVAMRQGILQNTWIATYGQYKTEKYTLTDALTDLIYLLSEELTIELASK